MKPALVILAAGESRRLGECKALVDLAGRSALERLLEAGSCFDERLPLVVTGADHERIAAVASGRFETARNPDWTSGRTGSVQVACRHRPGRDLVLAPVDVPLVPSSVFEALLASWQAAGHPSRGWLAPRVSAPPRGFEAYGHPIVLGRELLEELDRAGPKVSDVPLRELRTRAMPCWSVEVRSTEILEDLDTLEDLARMRSRLAECEL